MSVEILTAEQNCEWKAWQDVVAEFHRLGIDPDDPRSTRLIAAVNRWGEYLCELRATQTLDVRRRAAARNLRRYGRLAKEEAKP